MVHGQDIPQDPNQRMREEVASWIGMMSQIQREESEWARDREVLENYKEGLRSEIASLKEQVAAAETRKIDAGTQTQDLAEALRRQTEARKGLAATLRELERAMDSRLAMLPAPLMAQPKVVQSVTDLRASLSLPDDQLESNLSKRVYGLVELISEAEKFNQQVHLVSELHKDAEGVEYKLQMVYFGLAMAYGVSDGGELAIAGTATEEGWKFSRRNDLAPRIRQLVASAGNPKDASFTPLPLVKP